MHRCAGDGIIVSGVAVNQPIIAECSRARYSKQRTMPERRQDLVRTSDLKLGTRSLILMILKLFSY
jgi:hypothetical protein